MNHGSVNDIFWAWLNTVGFLPISNIDINLIVLASVYHNQYFHFCKFGSFKQAMCEHGLFKRTKLAMLKNVDVKQSFILVQIYKIIFYVLFLKYGCK